MRQLCILRAALVACLGAAALAGCGSAPVERFYTLSSAAVPEPGTAPARYTVGIGPVTVPESVDRPQLVVRSGDNRMTILEHHRWVAPLKSEVPRVLAASLARELPEARIAAYPEHAALNADVRVSVDLRRFEASVGGEVVVESLWSVRRADGSATREGRTASHEPAGVSYEDIAAAYGRALNAVSRDIAAAVRSLQPS
jgi:uncharacterized lipoprotein YmbA